MARPRTARYASPVTMRHTIGVSSGICTHAMASRNPVVATANTNPHAKPSVQVTSSTGMMYRMPSRALAGVTALSQYTTRVQEQVARQPQRAAHDG